MTRKHIAASLRWSLLLAALLTGTPASAEARLPAPGVYQVQADGSTVSFDVTEFGINNVKGKFHAFSGQVTVGDSLANSHVEATVDIASVDTNIHKRDDHLRSEEWLSAAKFPKMTFKSTSLSGNPGSFDMKGELTIKGVTKEVTFWTRILDNGEIAAEAKINRTDFGITAGKVVRDEVHLHLHVRLVK